MKKFTKMLAAITMVATMTIGGVTGAFTPANTDNFISIEASAASTVAEGVYVIQSALGTNKVVDISGGGTTNGTNCQLYQRNNSVAQAFKITSAGSGWYTIQLAPTNDKVLDVSGGKGYSGCNVAIWTSNGSPATNNQLWCFESAGSGYYYIKSKTGFYLDVSGGSSADGTNIQVYSGNKTAAQKFKLISNYNVAGAIAYAQKYTDNTGKFSGKYNTGYNIYEGYYKPYGNKYNDGYGPTVNPNYQGYDCANFASQCLLEGGGLIATNQWAPVYRGQKYKGNTAQTTWVSADNLYNYLSSTLRYPTQRVKSDLSNIRKGDIVFTGKGSHATICTVGGASPKYCAHTLWRKDYPYDYSSFGNGYVIDMSFATLKTVRVSVGNSSTSTKAYTIKASSGAKVRATPGTSGKQMGGLAKGSVVYYTETKSANGYTWYKISSVNAKSGSWGSYNNYWVANV